MESNSSTPGPQSTSAQASPIRVLGLGGAGLKVLEHLLTAGLSGDAVIAADSDQRALASSTAPTKFALPSARLPAANQDLDAAPAPPEIPAALKAALTGAETVFVVAGLGGTTGARFSSLLACAAREAG